VCVSAASAAPPSARRSPGQHSPASELAQADKLYAVGRFAEALPLFQRAALSSTRDVVVERALYSSGLCRAALCEDSLAALAWRTQIRRFPKGRRAKQASLQIAHAVAQMPGHEAEAEILLSDLVSDSSASRATVVASACFARARLRLARGDSLAARADLVDLTRGRRGAAGVDQARALLRTWPRTMHAGELERAVRAWQTGNDSLALAALRALAAASPPDAAVRAARALVERTHAASDLVVPWLGFHLKTGSAVVACAARDSAVSAGIRKGDVVRAVRGEAVQNAMDLAAAVYAREVNSSVDVVIVRNGRARTVQALVSALPRAGR
jgi:hypothetical protein